MLSKRQKNILGLIPQTGVLADVGCDHGKIGCRALAGGKAGKVIFIDVSPESLEKARRLYNEMILRGQIGDSALKTDAVSSGCETRVEIYSPVVAENAADNETDIRNRAGASDIAQNQNQASVAEDEIATGRKIIALENKTACQNQANAVGNPACRSEIDAVSDCLNAADNTAPYQNAANPKERCSVRQIIAAESRPTCNNLTKKEARAEFLCQNGLGWVRADCAVIAGMGGMEIIEILRSAVCLPEKLVLQPMKNADKVRLYAQNHYTIVTDYLFYDKKYYNLLYMEKGRDNLSGDEIEFGKTNLVTFSADFCKYLSNELALCGAVLAKCADRDVAERKAKLMRLLIKGEEQ